MSKLHNIPAEHRIIGTCLKYPEAIDILIDKIGPQDFSDMKMSSIYSAIARTATRIKITPAEVVEELRNSQELKFIGGDKTISWLLSIASDIDEAKENAKIIRDLARRRDQASAARRAADVIDEGGDPSAEIAELQEAQIEDDDGWTDLSPIVNGIITGTHKRLEPTILRRSDGECLLYPARLNLIAAPPESMKSWLAKLACTQQMMAGKPTIYIDCEESDGVTCTERLFSIAAGMGVSQDTIRNWLEGPEDELTGIRDRNKRLFYYRADNTGLESKTRATIMRIVKNKKIEFVVIDGFAAAMSAHTPPLEEDKARDVNLFLSGSVWPIVNAGAGILVVDHVTKNSGGIGQNTFSNRGPRGSSAKLAAVSGAALRAQVIQAGSAWQAGKVQIHIDKDRPGRVKIQNRDGKRLAGILISIPNGEGTVESTKLEILSPEEADQQASEKRWDLIAAEKISNLLADITRPMSKTEIKTTLNEDRKKAGGSGWRAETIVKALDFLVTNGWVRSEKDGRLEMLESLKKYNAEYGEKHATDHEESPF